MVGSMSAVPVQPAAAPTELCPVAFQDFHSPEPFPLELGGVLPELTLRYETYGTLLPDKSNAILVPHALSGDHHVAGRYRPDDVKPGWWDVFVGPGKAIDTDRFFVIGVNCIGGCKGSTGPLSVDPRTGCRFGGFFPEITLGDIVRAQRMVVRHLGIAKLHAVVGGSMGGMQALLWCADYPREVGRIAVLDAKQIDCLWNAPGVLGCRCHKLRDARDGAAASCVRSWQASRSYPSGSTRWRGEARDFGSCGAHAVSR